jgi:PIN domain nuclease of toxin-antitoxin system
MRANLAFRQFDPALSTSARVAIEDSRNEKYVSAITAWKLIAKVRSGKQLEFATLAANVAAVVSLHGFVEVPITMRHAQAAANLPFHHKDPMDRLPIGQAIVEDMSIITDQVAFANYAARLLW